MTALAAPTPAIETHQLSKNYGQQQVLRDISLSIRRGEVYALVGPNGAGKTTLIRLLTGLARPSAGRVRLLGCDPRRDPAVRRKLGAVVEAPASFYPYLSGRANLRLHARLAGGVHRQRLDDMLSLMQLQDAAKRPVGSYSLGMRQRLGVAAALLTEPEVLILDEPASGMDPLSLHLVHEVLQQCAQKGTAVFLSTHHLEEVLRYCSRVGILEQGQLLDQIDLLSRRKRFRMQVSDAAKAHVTLELQPFIAGVRSKGQELIFILEQADALGQVSRVLYEADIAIYALREEDFNLRNYYQERLQGRQHDRWHDPSAPTSASAPDVPRLRHKVAKRRSGSSRPRAITLDPADNAVDKPAKGEHNKPSPEKRKKKRKADVADVADLADAIEDA